MTLEGYAVEGGFDGPGEPATCYSPTIALKRQVGPGGADDLWREYETVLDFVPEMGFDGVRLTIEWARIEPRAGEVDDCGPRAVPRGRSPRPLDRSGRHDRIDRRGVARLARSGSLAVALGGAARESRTRAASWSTSATT